MMKKWLLVLILGIINSLIILYLPPKNIFIIAGFITLFSLFIYLFLSLVFNKKVGLITALFIGTNLIINSFVGFSFLNMILLISLLISLLLLLK